jgi:hypothetical protein
MPLYMDKSGRIEGLTPEAVAQAHAANVKTPAKYGVTSLRSWFKQRAGTVLCLVEVPDKGRCTCRASGSPGVACR